MEAARQMLPLGRLAMHQCDLLGIFAQARQREAEVRLAPLLLEIERDQRLADEVGDPGRHRRIDQRGPEDEAGNDEVRAWNGDRDGDVPEDDRERDQRRDLRQHGQREGIGLVQEGAGVLRDALVGVVGRAGERDAVMRAVLQPAPAVFVGHPFAPADQQHRLGDDLDQVGDRRDRGPDAEDPDQLLPEGGGVLSPAGRCRSRGRRSSAAARRRPAPGSAPPGRRSARPRDGRASPGTGRGTRDWPRSPRRRGNRARRCARCAAPQARRK